MESMVKDTFHHGFKTETAGTVIDVLVPFKKGLKAVVTAFKYLSGATAHTLTWMKPLGRTTLSAAAASGQAVINLVADPGSIAANDYVVLENNDGTSVLHKVSSVSGLAVTLTANLASAIAAGKRVWFLGVVGDHTARQLKPTASATTTYSDPVAGVASAEREEPLVLNSNNATAAGQFETVSVAYIDIGRQ